MSHMGIIHSLNKTRRGDQKPGIRERIHRIPLPPQITPRFYHASLLPPLTPHYPYSNDTAHTLYVDVSLLRMFSWWWGFAEVCVSLCLRKSVCLSVVIGWMCFPSTLLHFSGKTFCWIVVKTMWFSTALRVMKGNLKGILLSGYLKYLKPKRTRTILRLSLICVFWIPSREDLPG